MLADMTVSVLFFFCAYDSYVDVKVDIGIVSAIKVHQNAECQITANCAV